MLEFRKVEGEGFNVLNRCEMKRNCQYSHTKEEQLYHPYVYKTQLCRKFPMCYKKFCPFAHGMNELRQQRDTFAELKASNGRPLTPNLHKTANKKATENQGESNEIENKNTENIKNHNKPNNGTVKTTAENNKSNILDNTIQTSLLKPPPLPPNHSPEYVSQGSATHSMSDYNYIQLEGDNDNSFMQMKPANKNAIPQGMGQMSYATNKQILINNDKQLHTNNPRQTNDDNNTNNNNQLYAPITRPNIITHNMTEL